MLVRFVEADCREFGQSFDQCRLAGSQGLRFLRQNDQSAKQAGIAGVKSGLLRHTEEAVSL